MKQKNCSRNNTAGFTLIELLIVMAIFMIVVGAMYGVFESSNRSHAIQNEVVDAQNNLRAAVGLLTRELRMAGYDSTGGAGSGFVTADATSIRFTMDLNNSGVIDTDEDVEYLLDGTNLNFIRKIYPPGGTPTSNVIAENIQAIEFYYNDSTLTPTLSDIKTVTVSVLARTGNADPRYSGGESFVTPSGVTWTTTNGYRGRFSSVTVQVRNM